MMRAMGGLFGLLLPTSSLEPHPYILELIKTYYSIFAPPLPSVYVRIQQSKCHFQAYSHQVPTILSG